MKKDTLQLLITTYGGLILGALAITAYTAGVRFEMLAGGLLLGIGLLFFQIYKETKWKWKLIYIAILGIQTVGFIQPDIAMNFEKCLTGDFFSLEQMARYKWVLPISSAICLASFWVGLIGAIKNYSRTKQIENNIP